MVINNQRILKECFYERNTISVALDLLGKVLLHKTSEGDIAGKIVEVEAYLGDTDPACHASFGKTNRAEIFWGPAGRAYVFVSYGIHYCLNAITEKVNSPGCVLIRALEPIHGIDTMRINRSNRTMKLLTNGPAKLTQALGINKSHNGISLTTGNLTILEDNDPTDITITTRIGITKAKNEPLRFFITGNDFVSPTNNVSKFYEGSFAKAKSDFLDGKFKISINNKFITNI